ncbi:MAG: gliding motility-associated C-terminal domain-containing protein [Sediminibacterium sp.]
MAQTSISDCDGAIVLCGDLYTETQASFNTGNVIEPTGACNQGLEQSSVWYTFTVQQAGNLSFILNPLTAADDYDWGLFNITTGGCAGLGTTSPEVECNSYGLFGANGPTGISTLNGGTGSTNGPGNISGPPFNADLPVVVGQTYALVVMNWSNSLDGYTIDFGQSTASLYDQVPPVPISATTDCSNLTVVLTFSEPIVGTSVQPTDFTISGPSGTIAVQSVTANNPTMADVFTIQLVNQVLIGGTYTLNITNTTGFVEDACGNLGTQSITFEISDPINFDVSTTTACNSVGGSVAISNIIGGDGNYTLNFNGSNQAQYELSNIIAGNYTATITDGNGCLRSIPVVVPNQDIQVAIPSQDSLTCLNSSVEILGVEVNPVQNVSYAWTGTGLSSTTITNPIATVPGVLNLVVTNLDNGCFDSGTIEIYAGDVYALDLSTMILPNIITLKQDELNDDWRAILASDPLLDLTLLFLEYDLTVYNRWGGIVFESTASEKYWKATDVAPGSYFYLFHYKTDCGTAVEETVEGTILVVE